MTDSTADPGFDPAQPLALRPFTRETYRQAFRIKLAAGQEKLVADPVGSLAQAYFHEEAVPLGLFAGEVAVGFVMLSEEDLANGVLWVWRFLVDERYQRQGLGRRGMEAVVAQARARSGVHTLKLSHVEGIEGHAGPFYEQLGFRYTGDLEDGERVMVLAL